MNTEWAIQRLTELRSEYAAGESQIQSLQDRQLQIRDSMLRIDGAIQVLEEMIRHSGTFESDDGRQTISVN
jgi:prefoldin subunit 5